MFLLPKATPLNSREAMGFRGKLKDRSCFFCGVREENNFDKNGKLQMLRVISRNKKINTLKAYNHIYICSVPACIKRRPFI